MSVVDEMRLPCVSNQSRQSPPLEALVSPNVFYAAFTAIALGDRGELALEVCEEGEVFDCLTLSQEGPMPRLALYGSAAAAWSGPSLSPGG